MRKTTLDRSIDWLAGMAARGSLVIAPLVAIWIAFR